MSGSASRGSRWRSREVAYIGSILALQRRAEATSKPVLLPLAIILPEDTFALTEQLLKANVWHNHVVAHMLTQP